jgi:hypothetical protein
MIEHVINCLICCKFIKKQQIEAIINALSNRDLNRIGRIIELILSRKIKLPKKELVHLKKNKHYLYALVRDSKIKPKDKKEILKKRGGSFFPSLFGGEGMSGGVYRLGTRPRRSPMDKLFGTHPRPYKKYPPIKLWDGKEIKI